MGRQEQLDVVDTVRPEGDRAPANLRCVLGGTDDGDGTWLQDGVQPGAWRGPSPDEVACGHGVPP